MRRAVILCCLWSRDAVFTNWRVECRTRAISESCLAPHEHPRPGRALAFCTLEPDGHPYASRLCVVFIPAGTLGRLRQHDALLPDRNLTERARPEPRWHFLLTFVSRALSVVAS